MAFVRTAPDSKHDAFTHGKQRTTFTNPAVHRAVLRRGLLVPHALATAVTRCPSCCVSFAQPLQASEWAVCEHAIACKNGGVCVASGEVACPRLVHNRVVAALSAILRAAGYGTRLEVRNLAVGSGRRPGDVVADDNEHTGKLLVAGAPADARYVIDVTVAYVETNTVGRVAARKGGEAALKAEEKKERDKPELRHEHADFVPFALDSWGCPAPKATKLLHALAERAASTMDKGKEYEAVLVARWRQWISVALHNGVAELQHARLSAGAAQHPVGALAGGA